LEARVNRRSFAKQAAAAIGAAYQLGLGLPPTKAAGQSPSASSLRKLKVIVAGGHPGDPEYGCGGTIARLTAMGHEVVLLYLNDNEWGGVTAATRTTEARKACEILRARPVWAGQKTTFAIVDSAHYEQWGKLLDTENPDAVFTQWPIDCHIDHRATAMLTLGAWIDTKKKFCLYYYEVTNGEDTLQFSPTHYVNITETEPQKRAACYAHAHASPDVFYKTQDQVANFRGIESGYKKAEAFVHQVQSPHDPLRELGLA
jgi:N-acetylglucosamine malate deacetylase 1